MERTRKAGEERGGERRRIRKAGDELRRDGVTAEKGEGEGVRRGDKRGQEGRSDE